MDSTLLGQAVSQRGADLVLCLQTEQQGRLPPATLQQLGRYNPTSSDPEIKDEGFTRLVNQFIAKKADILFKSIDSEARAAKKEPEVDDNYAIMPALESFMGIPSQVCKEHFFNSLEKNELVIGVVTSVVESGLLVSLLCLDSGRVRDIDDMKIMAFCPLKEVPKIVPDQSALESFHTKDIVRGIVLNLNPETQRIIISLQVKSVTPPDSSRQKLGLISEDDFPVHYIRKLSVRGLAFDELLQSIIGFNNSGNVEHLLHLHYLQDDSLMRGLHNVKIPEKEYAENLRKWQCQKLALQSVAQGVALFKKGKQMEAMQHLNKALQIDESNVEALVARGALYANNESFSRAVEDFQAALKLNPTHANATKYLLETRLAQGKLCEDQKDYLGARECYQQAVTVDPTSREAIATLQQLEQKLVRSGEGKKPRKSRDESPRRQGDTSPRRYRDDSPRRYIDEPTRRYRDPSPRRYRDGSPRRKRDRSPGQFRDELPRYRDRSQEQFRNRSPDRFRNRSPERFRDKSPKRYRDSSPQRCRDELTRQYREESPRQYRNKSPQDYPQEKADKPKRPMEEEKQEPRQPSKKRKAMVETETSEPQQKPRRESGSGRKSLVSRQPQTEPEDNPYAGIFGRTDISIPCLGSPERIGSVSSFPEGYCNPMDPNFVPRSDQSREELTRDRIIISPHDAQFREELKLRRMSHVECPSPSEFDKSHSPKSAKSKSPFDEESFLYGESEYDTFGKKTHILKSQRSDDWEDEQQVYEGERGYHFEDRRSRKDSTLSPEWEHVKSQKVVRLKSPAQSKEQKRKRKAGRDSSSSSDSTSGSSSSSSSSSGSSSSSSGPKPMGDYYEKNNLGVPKGIKTGDSFLDRDYQLSHEDKKKSVKSLKKEPRSSEKAKVDKRRDTKVEKMSKDITKSKKQGYEKSSVDTKRRQTSLDRDSNLSGQSRGVRDDASVKSDQSASINRRDRHQHEERQRKPTDKESDKMRKETDIEKQEFKKRKFKVVRSSTSKERNSPEKVIQDASISSVSEKLESGSGESKKGQVDLPAKEQEEESAENPLLSRSLFHVASRWDSPPPIDIKIKPEARKYENIQISISTVGNIENDPNGIHIFSGKQLSKYRPNKHVDESDSEDDELERLFQMENKGAKKGTKVNVHPSSQEKDQKPKKVENPLEKAIEAKKLIEESFGQGVEFPKNTESLTEKSSSKDSKYEKDLKPKDKDHDRRRSDSYYDDDRRSDGDRHRSSSYRHDDKQSHDYRGDDRRRSDIRHDDRYDDRRHSDGRRDDRYDDRRHSDGRRDDDRYDDRRRNDGQRDSDQHQSDNKRRSVKDIHYDDFGDDYDYSRRDVRPRVGESRRCDKYCRKRHDDDERLYSFPGSAKEEKHIDSQGKRSTDRERQRSTSSSSSSSRSLSRQSRSSSRNSSRSKSRSPTPKKVASYKSAKSKPDILASTSVTAVVSMPGEGKKLPTQQNEPKAKERKTSLDEMESFLSNLKDRKKKQWIAEGKVKTNP